MRAVFRTTSSRTLIEPFTLPARRADSASMPPWISLDSPCTSEVQVMSPSICPSTWRSALADTSPLIETSVPMTEKVAPPLAMGLLGLDACGAGAVGSCSSDFFENMGGSLQEGARVHRAVVDMHLEMEVRTGRAAGVADRANHVACSDALPHLGAEGRHMGIAGHQPVAVSDLDHIAITRLAA